jgi:hypothetical protein
LIFTLLYIASGLSEKWAIRLMYRKYFHLFAWSGFSLVGLFGQEDLCYQDRAEQLFRDLEIVRTVDCKLQDKLPVLYNYQGLGGYFVMPSARMPAVGTTGVGYSYTAHE